MAPLERPLDSAGAVSNSADEADTLAAAQCEAAKLALASAGVTARLAREPLAPPILHILSHRRLTVYVYGATHARLSRAGGARLLEVDADGVVRTPDVGIARLTHKVLEAARGAAPAR